MAKQLTEAGADRDAEILAKAQELLAAADPQGTRAGKYTLDLRGAQVGSVGDHNTNTITFNTPPPAK